MTNDKEMTGMRCCGLLINVAFKCSIGGDVWKPRKELISHRDFDFKWEKWNSRLSCTCVSDNSQILLKSEMF